MTDSWRFVHYDRDARGRRVLMAIIKATRRRLQRGEPVDWQRVHRHLRTVDPRLEADAEHVRRQILRVLADFGQI